MNVFSKYIHEAEYRLTTFQDALQSPIPNSCTEKIIGFFYVDDIFFLQYFESLFIKHYYKKACMIAYLLETLE